LNIPDIKRQLSILQVLNHYHLKPNGNHMLCCPFHEDKTPSFQIYPKTNTWCCFSSNCNAGTGDVIEFIQKKEECTKHQAIEKAKSLISPLYVPNPKPAKPAVSHVSNNLPNGSQDGQELSRIAIMQKFFDGCRKGIGNAGRAREYATGRGLDYQTLKLGFSGEKTPINWGLTYKQQAMKAGLLLQANSGQPVPRFANCLTFALMNEAHQVVSIYGRHIEKDAHFYLPGGHQGLYPHYPGPGTQRLILTESIIDAASLLLHPEVTAHYSILACYGTNGFTEEHSEAINNLKHLQEIIIFFDGDASGKQGAAKLAERLSGYTVRTIQTPEGEDVNSLHVKGADFSSLLQPKAFSFQLDTEHTNRIVFTGEEARYVVKGGLKSEWDSLKVSLDIEHPKNGRKSRSKIDLYEDRQVERLAREAGEKLDLRTDLIILDLEKLTQLLEEYRDSKQNEEGKPRENPAIQIPTAIAGKCREFLRSSNLMQRFNGLIGKAGVVGEENNRLFLFGIATSYKMPNPLHALIQGSSGSGKTHLLASIRGFVPEDDCFSFTRVTDNSLYNYGKYDLRHKLLCMEDLDGMKEEAFLAFRELQSRGLITSSTSAKDEAGHIKAAYKIVYGPVASMACTTQGEIYEDNMSRCFLIAVDETRQQTQRIITYQNQKACGKIDVKQEEKATAFICHCVRLLKPYPVVNPYADKVSLPEEAQKIRRLNALYQSYVKQITLLHQYQRKQDKEGRLISEKEDLQIAAEIMFDSIVLKVDELDGSLRLFYEHLKDYVKVKGGETYDSYCFTQREVRQALKVSKTQLHRYINDLLDLEYIRQVGGYANRGYEYKILYWDNIRALRAKVKRHLQGQLDGIGK